MKKISDFLVTALLIVIPLYPKFPAIRIPGIYVAIRLEDFLIFFTLLVFTIPLVKNFKEIIKNKIARAIIVFLLVGLVATISGVWLTQTVTPTISFLHLFRRIEYLSLFFVGFLYVKYFKGNYFFGYLIKLLIIINICIFIYGFLQRYFNFPIIITQNEEYSKGVALRYTPGAHINSSFAGHYDLASYLVLIAPLFVSAFFVVKEKTAKILLGLSTLSIFWLLSSAASRISTIAFVISTSISLFLLKKYKEIAIIITICLLVFGFSPDLRQRYWRIFEVVKEKITSVITVYAEGESPVFEDRSTSIRLNVEWPRAIRALEKNPILGTGYSSITLATDNEYLRALGETGVVGFAAFGLIFVCFYKLVRNINFKNDLDSVFASGIIGSTIGILLTAVFIDIFEASKFATIYWLFVGFLIGNIKNYKYE